MTPEQQALYDKLIEESRQTAEGGFGNLYQSTGLLAPQRSVPSPAPPPAAPPPSRMDAIAAPPQEPYAARAPGPYGSGSPAPASPPLPPSTARRALPLDSMGPPPLTPADRPEVAAMWARGETPPPASVDVRRSPPVAQGGAGGGPIVERGGFAGRGSDIGMIADIFPGFFKNISRRRNEERAQQTEHNSRMAQLAYEAEQRRAAAGEDREAKAPGEARAAQQFAWEREDRERERGGREAASKAEAEKLDPSSTASERRRAAFRATNPELAVWMDKNDPGALGRVAAGDEQTWDMIEARAKQFKRGGTGTGKGRGGVGTKWMGGGPLYAAGLQAIADDNIPLALKNADEMAAAGDRKGADELRRAALQAAAASRRSDESGERTAAGADRKRDEEERGMLIDGWEHDPNGTKVLAPEANALRSAVAQGEILRGISNELTQINKDITLAERASAALGKHSQRTARAKQLQGQALTAIRTIEKTGVPSLVEMAIAAQKAPELTSLDGWLNGDAKYKGLVDTMDMGIGAEMQVRGYRRAVKHQASAGGSGAKFAEGQTATGPGGKKIVFKGGKWVPL